MTWAFAHVFAGEDRYGTALVQHPMTANVESG